MAETIKFRQTCGSIVGTYINIEYGDTIYDVAIYLGNSSNTAMISSDKGRLVTAAYKIVDDDFDRDEMKLSANDGGWVYCNDIEAGSINQVYKVGINGKQYIDTNKITPDTIALVKFKFPVTNSTKQIRATKVFFALFSTPEGADPQFYDVDKSSLTIGAKFGGEYYYRRTGDIYLKEPLFKVGIQSLLFGTHDIRHVTGDSTGNSSYKPAPCNCIDLRYRTFSNGSDNISNNGWDDGGEEPETAESKGKAILNTTNNFVSDFDISEGRLKDVIFAQPGIGAYEDDTSNGVLEARWVFKRSRIKFTIPPAAKKQGIVIRYKVEAAIHSNNKKYYKNEYKSCKYSAEAASKAISFVICPRDEGILDNTEFKVTIDRCYSGGRTYSDPVTYYFKTFQKPIVNIAYPKMVRNKATGDGFKYAKILTSNMYSNFQGENAAANKYVCDALNVLVASPRPDNSGIPLFVRYYVAEYKFGRNGCLKQSGNEWELDSDNFTTAMSIFKSNNAKDYTKLQDILDGKATPTAYVTNINNCDGAPIILSGRLTDENLRELITGYESTDENGNFIMAKGKRDPYTGEVNTISEEMRLWTCRKWDYVTDSTNDVLVLNGYPKDNYTEHDTNGVEVRYTDTTYTQAIPSTDEKYINGVAKVLTPKVVGDHCGQPTVSSETWADGKPQSVVYNPSKAILFRAGYVYLLRMRIFHGAAAGAIGSKYGGKSESDRASVVFGYGEDSEYQNSGRYDYSNHPTYTGRYPYNGSSNYLHKLDDDSQYGLDYPYTTLYERNKKKADPSYNIPVWHGPDDGTSGTPLNADTLNETYPGFSEVDYSLIEPVCPYTSTANLITVHPSSPQIGVNQWLSFNYRHLAKNIGGIDNYAEINLPMTNQPTFKQVQGNNFGKTRGGIQNTITRIMAMYTSCAETILRHFSPYGVFPSDDSAYTSNIIDLTLDRSKLLQYPTSDKDGDITYTTVPNPTNGLRNPLMYSELCTDHYYQDRRQVECKNYSYSEEEGWEYIGSSYTNVKDTFGREVFATPPVIKKENITLWIKPISDANHPVNEKIHPEYKLHESQSAPINTPLMYKYNAAGKTISNMSDSTLFTHIDHSNPNDCDQACYYVDVLNADGSHAYYARYNEELGESAYPQGEFKYTENGTLWRDQCESGLFAYNEARIRNLRENIPFYNFKYITDKATGKIEVDADNNPKVNNNHRSHTWAESEIVYASYNVGSPNEPSDNDLINNPYLRLKELTEEPLGNTYRWQPVINAVKSNTEELQIEGKNEDKVLTQKLTPATPDIVKEFKYCGPNTVGNRLHQTFGASEVRIMHHTDEGPEQDVQKKFFYEDVYQFDTTDNFMSCNSEKRFTINEFPGVTTGAIYSSGWPAMYTTQATPSKSRYSENYNIGRYHKYFSTALEIPDSYGYLYTRVPASQDCENGDITAYNGSYNDSKLPNTGGIITKVGSSQVNIDSDYNNIYPLTRTTHYLYFTTWINTTFAMKVDVDIEIQKQTGTDEEGNPIIEPTIVSGSYYYDPSKISSQGESEMVYISGVAVDDMAPPIVFGCNKTLVESEINKTGLSQVYGEDNNGWGRCLSNDDMTARKIKYNGDISAKTASGGIEVPIMTRYTPLLQPQIASETTGQSANLKLITSTSHNSTIEYYRQPDSSTSECDRNLCLKVITSWEKVTPVVRFTSGGSTTRAELEEVTDYDINIYYPMINENMTYKTGRPNGGTAGNVMYQDYFLDIDSDPSKSIDSTLDNQSSSSNLDFLGGYGICTAYSIFLVPSDPDLSKINSNEYNNYFRNTNNHWNYFNQPANYYSTPDIFKIRSKSVKDAGSVLVAHKIYPDKLSSLSYTLPWDDTSLPSDWKQQMAKNQQTPEDFGLDLEEIVWQMNNLDKVPVKNEIKGRCFRKFNLNFKNLLDGRTVVGTNDSSYDKAFTLNKMNEILGLTTSSSKLTANNKLKAGLTYDLVIVPIYDNKAVDALSDQADMVLNINKYRYDYTGTNSGTINGEKYGGGVNDSEKTIAYYGSNPLVLYNYLQVANIVERNGSATPGDYSKPSYNENYETNVEPCNNCNITYDDHAIIYPNVDNHLYNVDNGIIKECPGFWLNNSFKLVLRMPSFRTNQTKLADNDLNTIEYLSNGQLDSENGDTANDFEFEDIQIHIGKLSELKEYGYPYEMDNNLNRLISKDELAKAHIISYKDYWDKNVFSKKLNDNGYGADSEDTANQIKDEREKCTAGALLPSEEHYKNRFIEVNLANVTIKDEAGNDVSIYSLYPEGFYIQFRWKSAYAAGNTSSQWSDWHGGSCDGGQKWWGSKGINYFVPVRNYSDIHTEFRQFIKESYPGALSNYHELKPNATGQGSLTKYGNTISNEAIDSVSGKQPGYYYNGSGNNGNSLTVPDVKHISYTESEESAKNVYFTNNHDNPYVDEIQYLVTHDTNFTIPENVSNLSQQMWELLYVDYIVRNMCKLYYKPNHNNEFFNNSSIEGLKSYTCCNLAAPWVNSKPLILDFKCVGWDLSEIQLASNNGNNKQMGSDTFNENKTSPESIETDKPYTNNTVNNSRAAGPIISEFDSGKSATEEPDMITTNKRRWNRNKYYRKPITKQDFDELNEHLIKLTQFIRHESLTGKIVNTAVLGNADVLLPHEAQLVFDKSRRAIIGNDITVTSGASKINNINHNNMGSNYIQNIWQNILKLISSGNTTAAYKVEKDI